MMFMGQIGKLLVKTFLCMMDQMSQPEATLDLTTRIDATKEDYEKCVDTVSQNFLKAFPSYGQWF